MGDSRYIRNPNHMDNLVQNRLSGEALSRAASAAGKKGVEAKRKKKAMRELARDILDMQLADEDAMKAELKKRGVEQTEAAALLLAQLTRARAGDTEAARFLRDTSGQKPVDNVAIGNLDDKPFETLDLASLTEAQLKELIEEG